jgi:hypothetical protein
MIHPDGQTAANQHHHKKEIEEVAVTHPDREPVRPCEVVGIWEPCALFTFSSASMYGNRICSSFCMCMIISRAVLSRTMTSNKGEDHGIRRFS